MTSQGLPWRDGGSNSGVVTAEGYQAVASSTMNERQAVW